MAAKKSTKTGKNFRGRGGGFSGWPEYIALLHRFPGQSPFGPVRSVATASATEVV